MKPTHSGSLLQIIQSILGDISQVRKKHRQMFFGASLILRIISVVFFLLLVDTYPLLQGFDGNLELKTDITPIVYNLIGSILHQPLPIVLVSLISIVLFLAFQIGVVELTFLQSYSIAGRRDDILQKSLPLLGTHIIVSVALLFAFLFFIVPGIIFSVYRIFAPIITITTGTWGYSACKISKQYIQHHRRKMLSITLAFRLLIEGCAILIASGLSFLIEGYITQTQLMTLHYFLDILFVCIQLIVNTSIFVYRTKHISDGKVKNFGGHTS